MSSNNSNLNARITSLVKYVLDVKPYHTKLLGFTSEVSFNDTLGLSLTDSQPQHTLYHQNVWGSADIPTLAMVSDGTDASRTIVLPPTVMPRFSITDAVNYNQAPIGDDQAVIDMTDGDSDGVPDSSYPWVGTPTFSHQVGANIIPVRLRVTGLSIEVTSVTPSTYVATVLGSVATFYETALGIPLNALELRVNGQTIVVDASSGGFTGTIAGSFSQGSIGPEASLPGFSDTLLATAFLYRTGVEVWAVVDTGRYYVPFHNGSKVRVNNVAQTFGVGGDYIVDSSRSFIQFVAGKHPAPTDFVDINLLNADRLFISVCDPFAQLPQGYDTLPYEDAPYDVDAQADHFIIQVANSASNRHITSFVNLQPGTNKAVLDGIMIYPSEADGNIWQLVANGLFSMTVQQVHPIVGPLEQAIINEPFDNGKLAFTLRSPWIEYYLSSGPTSYVAYDMLYHDYEHYEGPPDEADFWPGNDIKTMYGQPIDPLPPRHPPVRFHTLGELKQRDIDGQPQYFFEFYTVPPQGAFIELRVEQAKQLNPRLQLSMHEKLSISQLVNLTGGVVGIEDVVVYATHDFESAAVSGTAVANLRIDELNNNRITEDGNQLILES